MLSTTKQMKNLFRYWDSLKKELSHKYIMLFLDYDGTLTPIVSAPQRAFISPEVKRLLRRLSKSPRIKLSIISGRALKDIKRLVGLKGIIYVGNHGLELAGPKLKFKSPLPPRYRKLLEKIRDELKRRICAIKGAFVEDKGFSLSLHYRLVNKKALPLIATIFHETTIVPRLKGQLKITSGKKVLEVRLPVAWDKGKVVLWLLAREQFATKNKKVFPIYIGDDTTDEDAFRALRNKGLTVFVGKPKESEARYYLKNTQEVSRLLEKILNLYGVKACQN